MCAEEAEWTDCVPVDPETSDQRNKESTQDWKGRDKEEAHR